MSVSRSLSGAILRSQVCRQCAQTASRRTFSQRVPRPAIAPRQNVAVTRPTVWARWHSVPASASRVYDFAKMRTISDEASPDRILIDVREPAELEAGYIPGAVNIPISSQPDALFLPDEEFEDRFGFSKPAKDKEVVFYCKAGVRASAAAQLAEQQGYKNVAEYRGSMLDWNKQGGPLEKP